MKTMKKTALAAVLMAGISCCGLTAQAEKLVIAGRDGDYGKALAMVAEMYQAKNSGLEIERQAAMGATVFVNVDGFAPAHGQQADRPARLDDLESGRAAVGDDGQGAQTVLAHGSFTVRCRRARR